MEIINSFMNDRIGIKMMSLMSNVLSEQKESYFRLERKQKLLGNA